MDKNEKPLIWLTEKVKTPPISTESRIELGYLLRRLQSGDNLGMPVSKPMPSIGPGVSELRVSDGKNQYRLIYRIFENCVLIISVFQKKGQKTSKVDIETAKKRLKRFINDSK